jgi:hypothetical protein
VRLALAICGSRRSTADRGRSRHNP